MRTVPKVTGTIYVTVKNQKQIDMDSCRKLCRLVREKELFENGKLKDLYFKRIKGIK